MRLIYSFKTFEQEYYKPLDSTFFKLAKLSVDIAKKNYHTVFYGDLMSIKLFELNNIYFDEVVHCESIENYKGDLIGMVKILAMMEQSEPYIISDFDSIIFKKLIQRHTIDFSYPELHNIEKSDGWVLNAKDYLYDFYKKPWDKYGSRFLNHNTIPGSIPMHISNHSVVMVSHPLLVTEIYREILSKLSITEQNQCHSMFIEQFLLTYYLDKLNVEYGYISDKNPSHTEISFEILRHDFIHLQNYNTDKDINKKITYLKKIYNV